MKVKIAKTISGEFVIGVEGMDSLEEVYMIVPTQRGLIITPYMSPFSDKKVDIPFEKLMAVIKAEQELENAYFAEKSGIQVPNSKLILQ